MGLWAWNAAVSGKTLSGSAFDGAASSEAAKATSIGGMSMHPRWIEAEPVARSREIKAESNNESFPPPKTENPSLVRSDFHWDVAPDWAVEGASFRSDLGVCPKSVHGGPSEATTRTFPLDNFVAMVSACLFDVFD